MRERGFDPDDYVMADDLLALLGDDFTVADIYLLTLARWLEGDEVNLEVDVFAGRHAGLVLAEVELRSEDDKPSLPTWVGREVTGDAHYYNTSLARHGLPDLVV